MKRLESFSVRNTPKIDRSILNALLIDHTIKGFATRFLEIINQGRCPGPSPLLKTISIGALLYRDVNIGASQFSKNLAVDALQLRIYHVDYDYQSLGVHSIVVTQIAKGTPHETWRLGVYDFPLWSYWLG